MASVNCPKCGREIPDDKPLAIIGIADVKGSASLRDFHDEGVIWEPHDSSEEKFKCPECGEYFAPDFVKLREKWKGEGR